MRERHMKGRNLLRAALLATASAMCMAGNAATSDPTLVFLRPSESSFWRTATNASFTVNIDYPEGAGSAELTVKGCTIALNLSDSTASAAGITVRAGHLNLQDSIVANNLRADYDSVGADLCVLSGASATISNSMLSADAPQSWTICGQTATTFDRATMRFGDPLFTTPLADVRSMVLLFGSYYYKHPYFNATLAARDEVVAFDVHLTEESPALGLGAYAAAGDDPALPTGTPAFGTLTMSFPEPYTDPHVMVPMAGSDPYLASVEVVLKVGGEKIASRTFAGVRKGDVLTFAPPLGLEPGTPVTAEATAKALV